MEMREQINTGVAKPNVVSNQSKFTAKARTRNRLNGHIITTGGDTSAM